MNKNETISLPRLVLFDFDGTLTKGDSLGSFLKYAVPWYALIIGSLLWLLRLPVLLFKKKNTMAEDAKAALLSVFFAGKTREDMRKLGADFYREQLSEMLRADLLQRLRRYRDAGDKVVVVSASIDVWLRPFCEEEDITLICTELSYENDVFKGCFSTPNCNRSEKARRIHQAFDLTSFRKIIAYGNSTGDAAMFEMAQEAWWVEPSGNLKKWTK